MKKYIAKSKEQVKDYIDHQFTESPKRMFCTNIAPKSWNVADKENILKGKEQVQDHIGKIDKCSDIPPLLARSMPIAKQKLAPDEKVKYYKGNKCN